MSINLPIPDIKTSTTAGDLQPSLTLAVTNKAKQMIADGLDVVNMCAGEPDFDTPSFIKDAAISSIKSGDTKYTRSSGRMDLCVALSKKFKSANGLKYAPDQIVVSPGGKFSLLAAIQVVCNPGDEVIVPIPSWLSYPEMIKTTGATPKFLETKSENNFCLDPDDLRAAITPKTKLLILNSPSNPIGNIYSEELLRQIADIVVEKNIIVISDEMYEKLVYEKEAPHVSIASFNDEIYQRTITINGFSKAYSMTGWRLGYLGAPLWLVGKISAFQSHATSNATSFAQAGALAALNGPQDEVEMMRISFDHRRQLIYELLQKIPGLTMVKPMGAFYIFPDISSFGMDAMTFAKRLLDEAHVAVIPGTPFGAPNNIRLSYACSEDNIRLAVKRISKFCTKLENEEIC